MRIGRERTGPRKAWRLRLRSVRRWSMPALSLAVLSLAMASGVRRSAEARRLSHDLAVLNGVEYSARDALARATHRADSLGSRERIEVAAGDLGLREPGGRVTLLPEPVEDRE